MRKIADTTELQNELRQILAYAQSAHPSRAHMASMLSELADRTAASERIADYTRQNKLSKLVSNGANIPQKAANTTGDAYREAQQLLAELKSDYPEAAQGYEALVVLPLQNSWHIAVNALRGGAWLTKSAELDQPLPKLPKF